MDDSVFFPPSFPPFSLLGKLGEREGENEGIGLTYGADEFHLDARVFEALAIFRTHSHGSLDGFAVSVEEDLFALVLVELHVDRRSVVGVFEDDVDVDGGGEEVGHRGG